MFPRALAVLLIIGGTGYILDTIGSFLIPDFSEAVSAVIVMPAGIAELCMVGYLVVVGVRSSRDAPVAEENIPRT